MNTSLQTYVLNIHIRGIFEKDIKLSGKMSMADPIAIGVETLRIDSGCSLEKEFTELICMNP